MWELIILFWFTCSDSFAQMRYQHINMARTVCSAVSRRSVLSDSFAAPWTAAHQAPPWDSPGENTGVGCHALLQGIFPAQGSNK